MHRFRYRAATPTGDVVQGVIEVPSRQSLLEQLRRRELVPVEIEAVESSTRPTKRRQNRRSAVAVWTRNVATLLGAAVPLDRALSVTSQVTTHEGLSAALVRVRRSVREGSSLADALSSESAFFTPVVSSMVSAGETSGALDVVFESLAAYLEEMEELRSQVRTALLYPSLMAMVAGLGVGVLLLFVVPRFSVILEDAGGSLPLTTTLLVGVSTALLSWWWVWLVVGIGVVVGGAAMLMRPDVRERWHRARLELPWVGDVESNYTTARFVRTLGILLRSGVPILNALRVARASVTNASVHQRLGRATEAVAEGDALAPTLKGVLPPLALQMIAVGEESGRLEELCFHVADSYDGEVRRALRTAVAMIEPAMILLFGALVGFVAIAMLQAIYSINSAGF